MAEPQLIDYIKKARQASQTDEQSRALLSKNGWTDAEVNDAFTASSQPEAKPQVQIQVRPQVQAQQQPKIQSQTQPQAQIQIKPQYKPEPKMESMPKTSSNFALKFLVIFIILLIVAGIGYYAILQTNLLENFFGSSATTTTATTAQNNLAEKPAQNTSVAALATVKLASVLQNYDLSKMTVYSFSQTGDTVAYCVPQLSGIKIDCFLNNQKLDNPYNYKPYWIGASPDNKRTVSLFLDPATKQSFIFENKKEGTRYDGTITSPKFSEDSQNFTFIVSGKDNKSFVVLDGKAFSQHDKIYGTPSLSSDKKFVLYGARDGSDLFWIADAVK
jgi:hypothetical protein